MSIQAKISELHSLKQELSSIQKKASVMRKRMKQLELDIVAYLDSTNQPGIKYKGLAILKQEKQTSKIRPRKEQKENIINILYKSGIDNAEKVYDEIEKSKKGSPAEKKKLVIKNNVD